MWTNLMLFYYADNLKVSTIVSINYVFFWKIEYSCSVWHPHKKKVIKTKLKKLSAEQLDLFRTILGVRQVSQKCYTI